MALEFSGNNYVAIPDDNLWNFGAGSFSLAATFQTGYAGYRNIIRDGNGVSGGLWGMRIESSGIGKLQFLIANASRSVSVITTSSGWADSAQHSVVGVRDSSVGQLRIYVDANSAASPVSDGGRVVSTPDGSYPSIGRVGSYDDEYFIGKIFNVSIFNRALSVAEVTTIHNARGSDNITNGVVGRWLLNEKHSGSTATAANSIIDSSGRGNHGTPVNSPQYLASTLKLKRAPILI